MQCLYHDKKFSLCLMKLVSKRYRYQWKWIQTQFHARHLSGGEKMVTGRVPAETAQQRELPPVSSGRGRLQGLTGTHVNLLQLSRGGAEWLINETASRNTHFSLLGRVVLLDANLSFISFCCLIVPRRIQLNKGLSTSNLWWLEN